MGRERQKKKNRSSIRKVKQPARGRTKTGKKKINFLGSEIIERSWDRSKTLSQNYKQLGLSSRLNAPTGGIEKKPRRGLKSGAEKTTEDAYIDPLAINPKGPSKVAKSSEVRVERDPETGRILRLIDKDDEKPNPLNDPLNRLSSSPEPENAEYRERKGIVADLEAQALAEEQHLARTKRPRQQSQREEEWVQRLVERHGDNYAAMFRDTKLNPMQQSEGDLKKRVLKWAKKHGVQ